MATALVTGSTSGIGAAYAERLASKGWDLVLVARTVDRLEGQATDLRYRFGGRVEVLAADLGDLEECRRVEHRLADRAHPVDLLVNNAGFGTNKAFAAGTVDEEQRQLDVLVRAVLRLTHAAVGGMVERGQGGVVNVSSVAGWVPGGTYSAAKGWVTTFSESVAAELSGTGVHVLAVCPGFTHTQFHQTGGMDVSRIPDWMWLTADTIVEDSLADLRRGRTVSVPSGRYKALATLARHTPRPLVRAIYVRARPKH